ncbi:unnamed protein product, partial [Scytosiphon promiscuus]
PQSSHLPSVALVLDNRTASFAALNSVDGDPSDGIPRTRPADSTAVVATNGVLVFPGAATKALAGDTPPSRQDNELAASTGPIEPVRHGRDSPKAAGDEAESGGRQCRYWLASSSSRRQLLEMGMGERGWLGRQLRPGGLAPGTRGSG